MTFISVETAYWALSTMAQCLAAIIGLILVAHFYFSQKFTSSKRSYSIQGSISRQRWLEADFQGYAHYLMDVALEKIVSQQFAVYNVIRLMAAMIGCLIGLLMPWNEPFVVIVFVWGIGALLFMTIQLYYIITDYEGWIVHIKKGKSYKTEVEKLEKQLKVRVDMTTGNLSSIENKEKSKKKKKKKRGKKKPPNDAGD